MAEPSPIERLRSALTDASNAVNDLQEEQGDCSVPERAMITANLIDVHIDVAMAQLTSLEELYQRLSEGE